MQIFFPRLFFPANVQSRTKIKIIKIKYVKNPKNMGARLSKTSSESWIVYCAKCEKCNTKQYPTTTCISCGHAMVTNDQPMGVENSPKYGSYVVFAITPEIGNRTGHASLDGVCCRDIHNLSISYIGPIFHAYWSSPIFFFTSSS